MRRRETRRVGALSPARCGRRESAPLARLDWCGAPCGSGRRATCPDGKERGSEFGEECFRGDGIEKMVAR